ncbi:MAG: hypothetical protein ACLUFH_00385 [Monoglobales bacterium]
MELQQIKKAAGIILACVFGMMIIQLAAPIILGILIQSLSFMVPIAFYHFFVKKKWRIRLVCEQEKSVACEKCENVSGNTKTEQSQETGADTREKLDEEKKCYVQDDGKQEREKQAYNWYMKMGRHRINGIISDLCSRGISECWIQSNGICNIHTEKGFRRAGNLPGYPAAEAEVIAALLVKDGRTAQIRKKYLYLSWNEKLEG